MVANLSLATGLTPESVREAFAVYRQGEKDARYGTRYVEVLLGNFGVSNGDLTLQRPQYLGGSRTPIGVQTVTQTSSATNDSPQGNLSANSLTVGNSGFYQSFTEYGLVLGLCCVRSNLTYQQGLNRHFTKKERFDFYWPSFAYLGEQPIYNYEIFCESKITSVRAETIDGVRAVAVTGADFTDRSKEVFGYIPRWSEYRYKPSMVSGLFNSGCSYRTYSNSELIQGALPIDQWHLAQYFVECPRLNSSFIEENAPVNRVVAIDQSDPNGSPFMLNVLVKNKASRPLPVESTPGLVDHF